MNRRKQTRPSALPLVIAAALALSRAPATAAEPDCRYTFPPASTNGPPVCTNLVCGVTNGLMECKDPKPPDPPTAPCCDTNCAPEFKGYARI